MDFITDTDPEFERRLINDSVTDFVAWLKSGREEIEKQREKPKVSSWKEEIGGEHNAYLV